MKFLNALFLDWPMCSMLCICSANNERSLMLKMGGVLQFTWPTNMSFIETGATDAHNKIMIEEAAEQANLRR